MAAPQTQFFPPCFLVVATAAFLATVAYWSFYFVQGPHGASFTPAPSTVTTTTGAPATPPPSPLAVALGAPRCPLALCEVRSEVLDACGSGHTGSYCILDELRPVCSVGMCSPQARCEADPAFAATTFQCDCQCAR